MNDNTGLKDESTTDVTVDDRAQKNESHLSSDGAQYLAFQLIDEEFAIDILQVQEIRNFSHITPIPNAPSHVKGAMNLRGAVVPIVDLREKFGLPAAEYSYYTVIIVVAIGDKVVGLVVDAVNKVFNLRDEDREAAPTLGGEIDSSFISGLAKQQDGLTTILNIERLIGRNAASDPQAA